MAAGGLVVDVPQLAARIVQEKFVLNPIDSGEEVSEENPEPNEKHDPVLIKKYVLVRHQKLQLTHETKHTCEQNCEGHKDCIRDHDLASSFMQKFVPFFGPFETQFSSVLSQQSPRAVVK
jgi:hypothetical protein